jgi:hypothetical protein
VNLRLRDVKLILFSAFVLLALPLAASSIQQHRARRGASANFSGSWSSTDSAGEFALTLQQHGRRLRGYHSAAARGGRRVDARLESDREGPSIVGTVSGHMAFVRFRSGYSAGAGGTARLILRGKRLLWRIIRSHGEHYLPQRATLTRDMSEKACRYCDRAAFGRRALSLL